MVSFVFMKLITFNIRGLGGGIKRRALAKLIKKERPDCMLIQESKVQNLDQNTIQRLWRHSPVEWLSLPAEGASGGLLLIWNSASLNLELVAKDRNYIWVKGTELEGQGLVNIVNVYAPPTLQERNYFWPTLLDRLGSLEGGWCIGGDFNATLEEEERVGTSIEDRTTFRQFVQSLGLVDLPL